MQFKALSLFAMAGAAAAQGFDIGDAAQFTGIPGMADLLSIYSKYATVDGFSKFQSEIAETMMGFIATQTAFNAIPTETDPAKIAEDPAIKSMASDIQETFQKFAATQTYLDKKTQETLKADLEKVAGVLDGGSSGSSDNSDDEDSGPSATGSAAGADASSAGQDSGATRVVALGGALFAGVAGVVFVL